MVNVAPSLALVAFPLIVILFPNNFGKASLLGLSIENSGEQEVAINSKKKRIVDLLLGIRGVFRIRIIVLTTTINLTSLASHYFLANHREGFSLLMPFQTSKCISVLPSLEELTVPMT